MMAFSVLDSFKLFLNGAFYLNKVVRKQIQAISFTLSEGY